MKKFNEKTTSFLDLLDSFDPENWEQLNGIPWPYLKLPPGGDSLVISEDNHQEVNVGQKALDRPTKVEIDEEKIKKVFDIEDAEYAKYLLHPLEFWTNIYIDFFNGMQKIYWLKFKDIYTWSDFVEDQLRMLSHGFVDFRKSQIFMLWKAIIRKNLFYINLLAAIGYADRSFYEKIIDKLKNEEPVE